MSTKIIFIVLGLSAAVALCFLLRAQAVDAVVWRDLERLMPAQALTPEEIQTTMGSVSSRLVQDSAFGHVRLANGDVWRFAFRSHHFLESSDSFSIFAGPSGTFHLRGSYFCCEVQFPDEPMPKDSDEFLAFLRQTHPSFESVP